MVNIATNAESLAAQVENDGFFILKNVFEKKRIQETREELLPLFADDVQAREKENIETADWLNDEYQTSLTNQMHSILFPTCRSPLLAGLITELLNNATINAFLEKIIGKNFRLRVDLVRLSSGINDTVDHFELPHVWHRDSPGEFTFGIFFDDMSLPNSGGTAFMKGTHWQPYDPIWDFMFTKNAYTNKELYLNNGPVFLNNKKNINIFNRYLKKQLQKNICEANGTLGDIYFFLNDIWHGRMPNIQGKRFMAVRFGGFPTEFKFKDDIKLPSTIASLPQYLQDCYSADQPVNTDSNTLEQRLQLRKKKINMYQLAHWEKQWAVKKTVSKARRDK